MNDLKREHIQPINDDSSALTADEINEYLSRFEGWELVDDDGHPSIQRHFKLSSFQEAMNFATHIGEIASQTEQYPRLTIEGRALTVNWWSKPLGGMHRNDFIMAARTDDIFERWDLISGQKDSVQEASDESFPASDAPAW